jgi:hypothetical protein
LQTQLFLADIKLPQIHNFHPDKNKLKMLSFKFMDDFWLLGQF